MFVYQEGEVPSTPKKLLGSLLEGGKSEAARLEEELMTSRFGYYCMTPVDFLNQDWRIFCQSFVNFMSL